MGATLSHQWFPSAGQHTTDRGALFWELRGRGKDLSQSLRLSQGGAGLTAMWDAFGPVDDDKRQA